MSTETVRGVVIHDADRDVLISPTSLLVEHDGRMRRLELRAARGVIRDVHAGGLDGLQHDRHVPSMEPTP